MPRVMTWHYSSLKTPQHSTTLEALPPTSRLTCTLPYASGTSISYLETTEMPTILNNRSFRYEPCSKLAWQEAFFSSSHWRVKMQPLSQSVHPHLCNRAADRQIECRYAPEPPDAIRFVKGTATTYTLKV